MGFLMLEMHCRGDTVEIKVVAYLPWIDSYEEYCSCFAPIAYKVCVSPQNLNVLYVQRAKETNSCPWVIICLQQNWKICKGVVVVIKKGEKSWKIWYDKKSTLSNFFFIERGYFDQKLPGESDKNGPDALQQRFLT